MEFTFLEDEVVLEVLDEDDEVDDVYRSRNFWEYLVQHPPQIILRLSQVRTKIFYAAKDVASVVMEADVFFW